MIIFFYYLKKKKKMNALTRLLKVSNCCRQTCVCGDRVRELLIKIPLNKKEELENEDKISEMNRQLKICKENYDYIQLIKDPKVM